MALGCEPPAPMLGATRPRCPSCSSSSFCIISTNFLTSSLWFSSSSSSSLLCSLDLHPSLSSRPAVFLCFQLLLCLHVHPFLRYPFLCLSWSRPPDISHLTLGRGLNFLCLSVPPPICPSPPARLCFSLAPVPHPQDPLACIACFVRPG